MLGNGSSTGGATSPAGPVQSAIFARRSIRKFARQPVDRAVISRLLDAAAQAPNHHLTRPWRFFVLDRDGPMRERLTKVAEDVALRSLPEPHNDSARAVARKKAEEIATVPVLVLAYAVPGRDEHQSRENYAAVACALQNLQLAAVEEGLVGGWSTGGFARAAELRSVIGAEDDWELVGALYLGWPADGVVVKAERPGAASYTRWLCD
jgi:nitroreductase